MASMVTHSLFWVSKQHCLGVNNKQDVLEICLTYIVVLCLAIYSLGACGNYNLAEPGASYR